MIAQVILFFKYLFGAVYPTILTVSGVQNICQMCGHQEGINIR